MGQKPKFYGWKQLAVLWVISVATVALPTFGGGVLNAYLSADLHFDRSTLGLAFAMFQCVSGMLSPVAAMVVTKRGVRFTVAVGALLIALGSAFMAVVHTRFQFCLAFGVVIALGVVATGPVVSQTGIVRWFEKRKALAISLIVTAAPLGGFFAVPLLDRLVTSFDKNWRIAWWVIAACNALAVLLAILFVKEQPSDLGQFPDGVAAIEAVAPAGGQPGVEKMARAGDEWTLKEVFGTSAIWILLLSAVGFFAMWGVFLGHGVVHLRDLGHAPAQAAFSFSLALGATILGNLIVGTLGDHIQVRFLWAGAVLCGLGVFLLLKATSTVSLYAFALCLGVGFGTGLACVMTVPARFFGNGPYAALIGISAAVSTTSGAVGTFLAGYAYDHLGSYSVPLHALVILLCGAGILGMFMKAPVRKQVQVAAVVRA